MEPALPKITSISSYGKDGMGMTRQVKGKIITHIPGKGRR
jgi:hypothetical protein